MKFKSDSQRRAVFSNIGRDELLAKARNGQIDIDEFKNRYKELRKGAKGNEFCLGLYILSDVALKDKERLQKQYSEGLKGSKFAEGVFDAKKTLDLLNVGAIDPATLTDEQKSQVEAVQEDIRREGSKALKRLNERIEAGDTYRRKEMWMSVDPQKIIKIEMHQPTIIKFQKKDEHSSGDVKFAKKKYLRSGDYVSDSKLEGKMGAHEGVWRAETELPEFDITLDQPTNQYRHHDVALTEMAPEDFIRAQYGQYGVRHYGHDYPLSYDEWAYPNEEKVDFYAKILRGEKHKPVKNYYGPDSKLPLPVLEYNEEGKLSGFQEGFHRGLAAKKAGLETMPVLIAVKRQR